MSQYFIKGTNQLNGILCYIKDKITFDKFDNQTWYQNSNPENYICQTSAHDIYPVPSNANNYVGFIINGFYIKPNHFVIKGRSVNSIHLLQNWDLIGLNQYKQWIKLLSKTNYPLYQNQFFPFDLKTNNWFTEFRIVSTGFDSSQSFYFCTFENIEFYGYLATTIPKQNTYDNYYYKSNIIIYILVFIIK